MVLGWSPFNSVSDSSALLSKWLLLLKIEISLFVIFCFITNQNELKFNCSYMATRTIPVKFPLIWFSGFRGEDLNVIVYQNMPNFYNWHKSVERKISQKSPEYMSWPKAM
jgi:hypothetical protein